MCMSEREQEPERKRQHENVFQKHSKPTQNQDSVSGARGLKVQAKGPTQGLCDYIYIRTIHNSNSIKQTPRSGQLKYEILSEGKTGIITLFSMAAGVD